MTAPPGPASAMLPPWLVNLAALGWRILAVVGLVVVAWLALLLLIPLGSLAVGVAEFGPLAVLRQIGVDQTTGRVNAVHFVDRRNKRDYTVPAKVLMLGAGGVARAIGWGLVRSDAVVMIASLLVNALVYIGMSQAASFQAFAMLMALAGACAGFLPLSLPSLLSLRSAPRSPPTPSATRSSRCSRR